MKRPPDWGQHSRLWTCPHRYYFGEIPETVLHFFPDLQIMEVGLKDIYGLFWL